MMAQLQPPVMGVRRRAVPTGAVWGVPVLTLIAADSPVALGAAQVAAPAVHPAASTRTRTAGAH